MGILNYGISQICDSLNRFSEAIKNCSMQMTRAVEDLKKLRCQRRGKWVRCAWCEGTGVRRNQRCIMCKGKCAIRAKYVRRWMEDDTYNAYANYDAKVTRLMSTLRAAQAMPVVGIGSAAIAAASAYDICAVFRVPPRVAGLVTADRKVEPAPEEVTDAADVKIEPVTGDTIDGIIGDGTGNDATETDD